MKRSAVKELLIAQLTPSSWTSGVSVILNRPGMKSEDWGADQAVLLKC